MKRIYKALFCGDRNWSSQAAIRREIRRLKLYCKRHGYELVIIEGEAPGADILSRVTAEEENVHVARVAALWQTRHQSAGPQRNGIMAALEPHEAVAFHEDIRRSKGTKDMMKKLDAVGIPYRLIER